MKPIIFMHDFCKISILKNKHDHSTSTWPPDKVIVERIIDSYRNNPRTPYLLTILVLKFVIVHSTTS